MKKKVLFFFNEVVDRKESFEDNVTRSRNIAYFNSIFDFNENDKQLFVKMMDESTGLESFMEFIDSEYKDLDQLSIILDFSVMVKPYFFILLKFLIVYKRIKKIFLLYTEPKTYDIQKKQHDDPYFTRGSNTPPKDMLSFSGCQNSTKDDALIILLGGEGQRAKEVTNEINPEVTIPINGFPSYRPEFKDICLLLNDEILKESQTVKNLSYAPFNDPFETRNELIQIYKERKKRYNISVHSIKYQTNGIGLFFICIRKS